MIMYEDDVEASMKVIVVGNGGVGKTSLIKRFCKNVFTEDYKKTIGVDFLEKEVQIPETGQTIRVMLWDTAGQEEFDTITANYYRGADAAVLVFATDDRESFDKIRMWHQRVQKECGSQIPIALVQNKIDLLDHSAIARDEPERLATDLKVRLYRASVRQSLNIEEAPTSQPRAATLPDTPSSQPPNPTPPPKAAPPSNSSAVTPVVNPTKRRTQGQSSCTLL